METIFFSNENLIALHKLEANYRKEFGVRHVLSEEHSMLDLIRSASASKSAVIQAALSLFVKTLSPEQKNQLVYRGAAVAKDQLSAAPSNYESRIVERSYRGVKSQVMTQVPVAEDKSPEAPVAKKPKRIYRGRVIED